MVVFRADLPAPIEWRCDACGDEGVISGWEGSYADLRRPRGEGARSTKPEVWVAEEVMVALRDLRLLDTDCERKKRGSNNRRAARETVAARHRKVANQRRDFHHKTAKALVADHDVIVVEGPKIANMVRRARPLPDPDNPGSFLANAAAAKTGLNKSISDAGWAQFRSILAAKAEEAGRQMIDVDPRHTSDRCEACGHAARENRVKQAVFRCVRCGHEAHADEHAARNILRAGLALLAADQAA